MAKKILKSFMITLVLIGIALTVLNFTPKLYAPSYFGTTTYIDGPNEAEYWIDIYGIDEFFDRHQEGLYYCVGEHSDCVVTVEY